MFRIPDIQGVFYDTFLTTSCGRNIDDMTMCGMCSISTTKTSQVDIINITPTGSCQKHIIKKHPVFTCKILNLSRLADLSQGVSVSSLSSNLRALAQTDITEATSNLRGQTQHRLM